MSTPIFRRSLSFASAEALALCTAGVAGGASAAVISYEHDTPQNAVPFDDSLILPSFDPSLGILTGVTVEATTSATAAVDVLDSTSTAKSFSKATATISLMVDTPDEITPNIMGVAGPVSGTAAPGFNDYPGNTASASKSVKVSTGDFSSFLGTVPGRYSADFSSSTFTGTSAPAYSSAAALGRRRPPRAQACSSR